MALTPVEFQQVADIWQEQREKAFRENWERTRVMACAALMPHTRKRSMKGIFPLPWDKEEGKGTLGTSGTKGTEGTLTKAERKARMRELEVKWSRKDKD
jgi:hypothetical protein